MLKRKFSEIAEEGKKINIFYDPHQGKYNLFEKDSKNDNSWKLDNSRYEKGGYGKILFYHHLDKDDHRDDNHQEDEDEGKMEKEEGEREDEKIAVKIVDNNDERKVFNTKEFTIWKSITEKCNKEHFTIPLLASWSSLDEDEKKDDKSDSSDRWFYVMPQCEEDLEQFLNKLGRRDSKDSRKSRELLSLLPNVADALACIHAAGWNHKDVKPRNIIHCQGRWTLIDYGLGTAIIPEKRSSSKSKSNDKTDLIDFLNLIERVKDKIPLNKVQEEILDSIQEDIYDNNPISFAEINKRFKLFEKV
jgi:tRNA A-37 threonylcarbamoyl transferase component Bud32